MNNATNPWLTLQSATAAFARAITPQQIFDAFLEHAIQALGAQGGALHQLEKNVLLTVASIGYDQPTAEAYGSIPLDLRSPATDAMRSRGSIWIQSAEQYKQLYPNLTLAIEKSAFQAGASIPLIAHQEAIGVLNLSFHEVRIWSQSDQVFLESMADLAAGSVERARLFENEKRISARFEAAERAVGGFIYEWNLVTQVVWRSAGFAKFLGAENLATSLTSQAWLALVHPDDRLKLAGLHIQEIDELSLEYRVRHQDGHWIDVLDSIVTERNTQGKVCQVIGSTIDITKRKRAEDEKKDLFLALEASEQRFRTMIDGISQLAWIAEPDGQIFWFNRRWYEYTGTTPQEMQGLGWQSVHDPEILPSVITQWENILANGESSEMEFPLRNADGNYRMFLTRIEPIRDPQGKTIRWFGTNTDISSRSELETKLREVSQAQRRFVSDAAHELRAPLTSIRGNLQLLRRHSNIPEDQRQEMLDDAERETSRLSRLITDLLDLARGETQVKSEFIPIHLHELVNQTTRSARLLSDSHTLDLTKTTQVVVKGSRDKLKQLFFILFENAFKYTPKNGSVRVWLEVESDFAVVCVQDSGMGISRSNLELVFERFYRVDQGRARGTDPGGTGLGLTIARGIAQQHGGTVHLESELDVGTKAIVKLPLLKLE